MSKWVIHNGDCIRELSQPRSWGIADVVVTSPPYNIGTPYATCADHMPRADYLNWTRRWSMAVRDTLTSEGSLFLNMGNKPSDPWLAWEVAEVVAETMALQNTIHWIKAIAIGDEPVQGHVKPVNSPRYLNSQHEYVFHFTNDAAAPLDKLAIGVPYADTSNLTRGTRGKNGNVRDRGNTWFIPYETISNSDKERPHPATFPVELARRCVLLHGLDRVKVVLDPFCGIGTTGLAALALERDFVGFDIDPGYCAEARRRLELFGTVVAA